MLTNDRAAPGPSDTTPQSTADALRHDPVTFVRTLHQTYGDVVRLPLESCDLYLLSNPADIREMFVGQPEIFKKRKDEPTEQAYLVAIGGFTPFFEVSRVPEYAPMMAGVAAETSDRWRASLGQDSVLTADIYREMMQLMVEIVSHTLFGRDALGEAAEVAEALLRMNIGYGFDPIEANVAPVLPPHEIALTDEGKAARERLLAFVQHQVAAEVAAPTDPPAFLSLLVKYMGPEPAASVGLTVMMAMHEVTANTLTWAWYELSQHPEAEAQLHAELAKVLKGRLPTYEDLARLPYTEMVLAESRRMHPCVWTVVRFVRKDVTFGGFPVPADSVVMASAQAMHYDPRFFPDPERFDPARWTPEAQAALPEYAYFPFSEGIRECAGGEFAKTQDALILATLAQRWRACALPNQRLEPAPQKSNTPRFGIQMTLEPR